MYEQLGILAEGRAAEVLNGWYLCS
jgi:hypothetical protein